MTKYIGNSGAREIVHLPHVQASKCKGKLQILKDGGIKMQLEEVLGNGHRDAFKEYRVDQSQIIFLMPIIKLNLFAMAVLAANFRKFLSNFLRM